VRPACFLFLVVDAANNGALLETPIISIIIVVVVMLLVIIIPISFSSFEKYARKRSRSN